MALRLGRVYPLHFFMLCLFALAETAKFLIGPTALSQKIPWHSPNGPSELLASVGLVHVFGNKEMGWNAPSWSIAAEVWVYFLVAILLSYLGIRSRKLLIPIIIGSLLVLLVQGEPYLDRTVGTAIFRCLAGFALGMFSFDIYLKIKDWQISVPTLLEFTAILAVISFVSVCRPDNPFIILAPFVFAMAVIVFAREGGGVSRLLKKPFPMLLGTLSYSIYMVHTMVEARMIDVLNVLAKKINLPLASISPHAGQPMVKMLGRPDSPLIADAMSIVVLAAIILASLFTYRFVELPCRDFVRHLVGRQGKAVKDGQAGSAGC